MVADKEILDESATEGEDTGKENGLLQKMQQLKAGYEQEFTYLEPEWQETL